MVWDMSRYRAPSADFTSQIRRWWWGTIRLLLKADTQESALHWRMLWQFTPPLPPPYPQPTPKFKLFEWESSQTVNLLTAPTESVWHRCVELEIWRMLGRTCQCQQIAQLFVDLEYLSSGPVNIYETALESSGRWLGWRSEEGNNTGLWH